MVETDYPLRADIGHDDLPRTLRKARAEREAKKRAATHGAVDLSAGSTYGPTENPQMADGTTEVQVSSFNVPFFRLMGFCIKLVLAAIPALILLAGIVWAAAYVAQTYFPWLINMQIFIHFPD